MRKLLLFSFSSILILLNSCSDKPTSQKENNKSIDTLITPVIEETTSSIKTEEPSTDFDCPEEKFEVTTGSFFKAYCKPLCDGKKGILLDYKKAEKYGRKTPYNLTYSTRNDSAIIQFDIIYDCCLDFVCNASKNKNLLSLSHSQPTNISCPCDCFCDYKMVYEIKKQNIRLDSVLIRGKLYPLKSL